MKKLIYCLIFYFIALVAVFYFKPLGEANPHLVQSMYNIASFATSLSAFLALRAYGKGPRFRSILFLLLGFVSWFIADVSFGYFDLIENNITYPSFADYFYLVGYVFLFIGLMFEIVISNISWRKMSKQVYLISGIFTTCLFAAFSYYTLFSAYDPTRPAGENLVTLGYSVGDLFLVTAGFFIIVAAWEYRGGKASKVWISFLLGFLITMSSSLTYATHIEALDQPESFYYAQIQIGYITGYLFFTYALLYLRSIFHSFQKRTLK